MYGQKLLTFLKNLGINFTDLQKSKDHKNQTEALKTKICSGVHTKTANNDGQDSNIFSFQFQSKFMP